MKFELNDKRVSRPDNQYRLDVLENGFRLYINNAEVIDAGNIGEDNLFYIHSPLVDNEEIEATLYKFRVKT